MDFLQDQGTALKMYSVDVDLKTSKILAKSMPRKMKMYAISVRDSDSAPGLSMNTVRSRSKILIM